MSIKERIKPHVPRSALPAVRFVQRASRRGFFWYAGLRDRRYVKKTGFAYLPPPRLRYRVHGANIDRFLRAGKRCSGDIRSALGKVGGDFDSLGSVLDFGCGCGRTIIWFADRERPTRLHGTDVDAEAISWCQDNLDFAEFTVNGSLPPLDYPPEAFDLVYAISVFTHLDEDHQFRWLEELRRVTTPGGLVLLTVHGPHAQRNLPPRVSSVLEEEGFAFTGSDDWRGVFPEWYQTAYHTERYVLERYSEYFDVLEYLPRGMNGHQDVVVLRKPPVSDTPATDRPASVHREREGR